MAHGTPRDEVFVWLTMADQQAHTRQRLHSPMRPQPRKVTWSSRSSSKKSKRKWVFLLVLIVPLVLYFSLIVRVLNNLVHHVDHVNPDDTGNVEINLQYFARKKETPKVAITDFSKDLFYNISSDGTNLWDDDKEFESLPRWMKSYFDWHKHKRKTWSADSWESERWMIMQCLDHDRKCGGTADRLKPIPWALRVAYQTNRILLIRWTRPVKLEEFLVPPKGGMDWRVPEWMADIMQNKSKGKRLVPSGIIRQYAAGNMSLVRTRYQSFNGGSEWYDEQLIPGEPKFDDVFHTVWRLLFTPSQPIATIITQEMQRMHLVPGHYVGAHLRALYAIAERPIADIRTWTTNALNCASQLRPGSPIFFTSDSDQARLYSLKYASEKHAVVGTRTPNPNPPLHLDRERNWENRPISDFYDTFVDLYLLALGGCVTYNKGGFGHWGLLIGGNVTCFVQQQTAAKGIKDPCSWKDGPPHQHQEELDLSNHPLFLPGVE